MGANRCADCEERRTPTSSHALPARSVAVGTGDSLTLSCVPQSPGAMSRDRIRAFGKCEADSVFHSARTQTVDDYINHDIGHFLSWQRAESLRHLHRLDDCEK